MLSMHQQLSYFELDTNSEHDLLFPLPQFPVHPLKPYDNKLIDQINILVTRHHSPTLIQLQDQIHFNDTQQYLRRYYRQHQQNKKIGLLGEYYRYHFEAPRLFMAETARIIEENVDEKRMLEYALVTNQLNSQKKQTIATVGTARVTAANKIIQDVELSYTNFEQKQKKTDKKKVENKQKQKKASSNPKTIKFKSSVPTEQSKQKMKRTPSLNSKGSFFTFNNRPNNKPKQPKQTAIRKTDQFKKPKLPSRKNNPDHSSKNQKTEVTKIKKNSVNSSIVSNQKKSLSRSQSRTQLTVFESNKLPSKKKIVSNNPVLKSSTSQSNFSNKMSVKSMKNSINSHYNSTNSSQQKKQRTHIRNNEQKVNRVAYNTIDGNKSRDTQNIPLPVEKTKNKGKDTDCDKTSTKDSKKGLMFGKAIQLRKNR